MEKQGFKTTSIYFRNAGTIWFILGILFSIIANLELTSFIFRQSDVLWYGKIQPFIINILIFGTIISYFLAATFDELDKLPIDMIKPTILGNLSFGIYQFSLIFGLIVLIYGYNQGRTYGELNFITDNLFMLVFTIVVVLTLVYANKYKKLTGSLQYIIVILSGIMTSFFIGNFGFPNSYITNVPPTSGFQDAMVSSYYKTAVLVFYIALPLIFVLYSSIKNQYNINDEEQNFLFPLMILVLLVAFSSGAGLEKSAFRNFWTIIGNYLFSSINMILLGLMYIIHQIYYQNKKEKGDFIFAVSGTLLSLFFLYNFIISLPVVYSYFQYTFADSLIYQNKMIYFLLPIFIAYNIVINSKNKSSAIVSSIIMILGILIFIIYIVEGIVIAKFLNSFINNELEFKSWKQIWDKNIVYIYIRMIIDIIFFILSFYLIYGSIKEKSINVEQKQIA